MVRLLNWERSWKHEHEAMVDLAQSLGLSVVHKGGLTANLKEVKDALALKIGTGETSKTDKEAKSKLDRASFEGCD